MLALVDGLNIGETSVALGTNLHREVCLSKLLGKERRTGKQASRVLGSTVLFVSGSSGEAICSNT